MDVLFLPAPYAGTVELSIATLKYLRKNKYKTVALYASIQFSNNLEKVKQQLQDNNIVVITSRPDRSHAPSQLLGCDQFHESLQLPPAELERIDCYLYVGDGKFHPLALAYRQRSSREFKEIVCADPIRKSCTVMTNKDVEKIIKKYISSLMKFLSAQKIGVIITVKPGQEQMKPAFFLEKKFSNKKFYYFVDDVISFNQLENFPFIEVWINTACPRIGLDDQEQFRKGVINLNEALRAEELLANIYHQ
ncbi:MAG: diphthamide synthesis protein [Nanoarchaeota archaeon]